MEQELNLTIEDSDVPLYLQIAEAVQERIRSGELAEGFRLPPVRTLAKQLGVNRGSVALAYSHLGKAGLVRAGLGKGTFVRTDGAPAPVSSARKRADDFWEPFIAEMNARVGIPRHVLLDGDPHFPWVPENGSSSTASSHLAMDLPLSDHRLSYPIVKSALQRLAETLPAESLTYGHPQGLFSLRSQLAERARREGMDVEPGEILVCNGTQQALSLLCAVLLQPGDTVAMANPGYPGAARVFRMCGAKIIGLPLDQGGLRVDLLDAIFREHRPRFVYVVPTFQVPTGTTLSIERRERLYRCAEQHGVPIVEDEYANPLYYGDRPPPTIKSLDHAGLVVYVGTFSKTLGASLRLGWVACQRSLLARLVQAKEAQDIHTSLFIQMLVDGLLADGTYDKHLGLLRAHYGERYRTLVRELTAEFEPSRLRFLPSGGAFSIWVTLPPRLSAERWLHFARMRGVHFHLGTSYFLGDEDDNHAQLCFSHLDPEAIETAVGALSVAYEEARTSIEREMQGRDPFLPFS
ncbi:MAG: PLP-dependent aminotransferase family protein [Burkholderiaceae bacterium]|nr:PLP-dependent aminotransferase family protein [Burkholderiaceae bacterium]